VLARTAGRVFRWATTTMIFVTASTTEPYQSVCQDRVAVFAQADRTVIVVADGAGGTGSGEQASKAVVEEVQRAVPTADSSEAWCTVLRQIDHRIGAGESTALVVDLRIDRLCGASVGDSQAWVVKDADITNLTASQRRKPLLGSGEAAPIGFTYGRLDALLIVATDGFCNYVNRVEMVKLLPYEDFVTLPRSLVELVRLRSGALNDDVSIVVCRCRRPARHGTNVFTLQPEDFA
jgi:PPM family protein phosphatase